MNLSQLIEHRRETFGYSREHAAHLISTQLRLWRAEEAEAVTPWFLQELEAGRVDYQAMPLVYMAAISTTLAIPMERAMRLMTLDWSEYAQAVSA